MSLCHSEKDVVKIMRPKRLKIFAACSSKHSASRTEYDFFRAIVQKWPRSKLTKSIGLNYKQISANDCKSIIGNSDQMTILEFKGHIEKNQYQQYREARKNNLSITVFRGGLFHDVKKICVAHVLIENYYFAKVSI
jgi:hypothetical protein